MKIIHKTLRGLAITLVCSSVIWLAEVLGPKPAVARVYQSLERSLPVAAELLGTRQRPVGNRVFIINDQKLFGNISTSQDMPRQIIDRLEQTEQQRQLTEPVLDDKQLSLGDRLLAPLRKPFRADGSNWGVYGKLLGAPKPDQKQNVLSRLAAAQGLGPAAREGYMVFAQRSPEKSYTDVWTLRFSESFDPIQLMRADAGDVPGKDIDGITRFPGTLRIGSISEFTEISEAHIVMYLGSGSVPSRVSHFQQILQQAGYRRGMQATDSHDRAVLQFSRSDREVDIFISQRNGLEVMDVIQVRKNPGRS